MRTNYEQSAWESTLLWVWSKQCGSSGDPHGLIQIQVRVIEDVPEPIYDLSISLRPIRNSNDRNSALALLQCIAELVAVHIALVALSIFGNCAHCCRGHRRIRQFTQSYTFER